MDESYTIGTGKFAMVHLCNKRSRPEHKFALKAVKDEHIASVSMLEHAFVDVPCMSCIYCNWCIKDHLSL